MTNHSDTLHLLQLLSNKKREDTLPLTLTTYNVVQNALKPSTLLGTKTTMVRWWLADRQMDRGLVNFLCLAEQ